MPARSSGSARDGDVTLPIWGSMSVRPWVESKIASWASPIACPISWAMTPRTFTELEKSAVKFDFVEAQLETGAPPVPEFPDEPDDV